MARTVETRLVVRDEMSPALARAAQSATQLAAASEKAGRAVDGIGRAKVGTLPADLNRVGSGAAASAKGLDAASRSAAGAGSKMTALGGGLSALNLGTVATVAGVAALGKSFMDFDKNMSAVAANTGATAAELEKLRALAIQLGGDTQFSGAEAAAGINEMGKAGIETTAIINGGLKGALDLAAAGQMGVADAAELAATASQQFQKQNVSATHVADLYAAAANKAQGSVADIGSAMKYAGVAASSAGISIEETTGILALFASKGIIGEQAGTSFRSMLMSLTAPSQAAAETMNAYGLELYDAQGKFVGMSAMAGQLHEKLGGLNQAERDAALGRIFGNEAIGAAITLMEGGSAAVQKWTADVNDVGAASRQAAALTDNLAGDFEKLSGALDSVILKGGSGINETFRGMTKGATALVDAVGAIPSPVIQGAAALAAMNAAGRFLPDLGPKVTGVKTSFVDFGAAVSQQKVHMEAAAAAAGNAAPRFMTLQAAMRAAGGASGILKGAAGGLLGVLGGPWGVALMAAGAALSYFAGKSADAKAKQEELKSVTDSITSTLVANGGAWGEAASQQLISVAQQKNLIGNYQAMGYSVEAVTSALIQEGAARQDILAGVDAKIAALKAEEEQYYNLNGVQDASVRREREYYEQQRENLLGAIQVGSEASEQARVQAEANKAAGEAAAGSIPGINGAADATGKAGKAASAASMSVGDFEAALKRLLDTSFGVEEANDKWITSLEGLGKSNKTATAGLTGNTAAAAKNREEMRGLVTDGAQVIASMQKNKASQAELDAKANELADTLEKQGHKAGYSKGEVKKYSDTLRNVPKRVSTDISADTSQASAALQGILGKLNDLERRSFTAMVRVATSGPIGMLGMNPVGRATGGAVFGAGTATSDSIPAMLSNGEHVLTAREVAAAGGHGAVYRLRRALLAGTVEGYKTGGRVGLRDAYALAAPGPVLTEAPAAVVLDVMVEVRE